MVKLSFTVTNYPRLLSIALKPELTSKKAKKFGLKLTATALISDSCPVKVCLHMPSGILHS